MNEFYNKIKYFEVTENIPPRIYYHYTSISALFSIVSSKAFRLTNLSSTNDSKELFYKPEKFIGDLTNSIHHEKDIYKNTYLNAVIDSVNRNKAEFLKLCKKPNSSYALSLSTKKDNLTHWDRYASGCSGVCIAFNVAAIRVLSQRMASSVFGNNLFDIENIYYSSDEIENQISEILLSFAELAVQFKKLNPDSSFDFIRRNGFSYAAVAYQKLMKFSKDTSFLDEDEVRLYFDSNSIKDTLYLITSISGEIDPELYRNLLKNFKDLVRRLNLEKDYYCSTNRGIRSFRELNLKEIWGSGTIPEIILGPMCTQNRSELLRFLKSNGLEGTKVSSSKVPIR